MATSLSGGAQRGGWSWTLTTKNVMQDPQPQPSLSEDLRLSAGLAHRRQIYSGPEFRSYRRSNPLGLAHRHRGDGR